MKFTFISSISLPLVDPWAQPLVTNCLSLTQAQLLGPVATHYKRPLPWAGPRWEPWGCWEPHGLLSPKGLYGLLAQAPFRGGVGYLTSITTEDSLWQYNPDVTCEENSPATSHGELLAVQQILTTCLPAPERICIGLLLPKGTADS